MTKTGRNTRRATKTQLDRREVEYVVLHATEMVRFGRDGGENRHIQNGQNLRVKMLLLSIRIPKIRFFIIYGRQLGFPTFFSPWLHRPCCLSTWRVPNQVNRLASWPELTFRYLSQALKHAPNPRVKTPKTPILAKSRGEFTATSAKLVYLFCRG